MEDTRDKVRPIPFADVMRLLEGSDSELSGLEDAVGEEYVEHLHFTRGVMEGLEPTADGETDVPTYEELQPLVDLPPSGDAEESHQLPERTDQPDYDSPDADSESEDTADVVPKKKRKEERRCRKQRDPPPPVEGGNFAFTGPPPVLYGDTLHRPVDYFRQFVTREMLNDIAQQTGVYHFQQKEEAMEVTSDDIENFIAVLLRIGIIQLPAIRDYFSKLMRIPSIADYTSRDRFLQLLRHIHFVDNNAVSHQARSDDKVWKLRPWIDALRTNFKTVTPNEHNAIDETMVAFYGQSSMKQYIPGKPVKWGFKLWGRASPDGFMNDFDVYQGSTKTPPKLGQGPDVVLKLTEDLPDGQGYKIYGDNLFTSCDLVDHLSAKGKGYIGCIRSDRLAGAEMQTEKEMNKEGRGCADSCSDTAGTVILTRWFDNRVVTIASNFVGTEPQDTVQRYDRKLKKEMVVPRPAAVAMYNRYMGGIDQNNYLVSLYKPTIRSRRWYIFLFRHTLQMAVTNAWLIYKRHFQQLRDSGELPEGKMMSLKEFIWYTSTSILQTGKKRGRPSGAAIAGPSNVGVRQLSAAPPQEVVKDGSNHWPIFGAERKRCKHCQKLAAVKCYKCDVALCFLQNRNCFYNYHN